MIRVADYIVEKLAKNAIGHVFMVTGGAAMHLNDAFGTESRTKKVYCHHEQACAIAAENRAQFSIMFKRDHKSEG
jgi:acetolactate synthase-1/2/3 large subunit